MTEFENEKYAQELMDFFKKYEKLLKNRPHPHQIAMDYANAIGNRDEDCKPVNIRAHLAMAFKQGYDLRAKEPF